MMSTAATRERISIKDIEKILGLKRAKAERLFSAMRAAKVSRLEQQDPTYAGKPYLFVDDLVSAHPGLTRDVVKAGLVD